MNRNRLCAVMLAALTLAASPGVLQAAQRPAPLETWVGAWGFAPVPQPPGGPSPIAAAVAPSPLDTAPPPAPQRPAPRVPPIANPGGVPVDLSTATLANVTFRELVRVSVGGSKLRLRLSNEASAVPLVIGAVSVGLAGPDGALTPGSSRVVTFDGRPDLVMPAGAPILSDPVDLPTTALQRLYVSVHVPGQVVRVGTLAPDAAYTYVAGQAGDFTQAQGLPDVRLTQTPALITGVEVTAPAPTNVVVTLGDSITRGGQSTFNAFASWPDRLAERLAAPGVKTRWSVVNMGLSGNRLLRFGAGPSALSRLDRDVLSVPGLKTIVLLEGINDIQRGRTDPTSAQAIIAAQKQIVARARARGVRVVGATLTPFKGANNYTEAGEAMRQALNAWIRTGGAFDAVIDFDKAVADPADPISLDRRFNDVDHLHPNDVGYRAMGDAIDLSVLDAAK